MIWLTWRQHRKQLLFALIALAAIAALIIATGKPMHDNFVNSGLSTCLSNVDKSPFTPPTGNPADADCQRLARAFNDSYSSAAIVGILFLALPLFVGLFFGAPLVAREIEQGTHRLVWTQGITRRRWALVKFGFIAAATTVFAIAYGALSSWWNGPIAAATGRTLFWGFFDQEGVAPIAYTLFAVALGTFAGTIWRKSLSSMAVTLVSFVGIRLAVTILARPHFLAPTQYKFALTEDLEANNLAGNWLLSQGVYNADGSLIEAGAQIQCGPAVASDCVTRYGAGAYNLKVFQAADRFWVFQSIEAGVYVLLAAALILLAVHQVRRRIS